MLSETQVTTNVQNLPHHPAHFIQSAELAEPSVMLCSLEHDRCQMTGWPNARKHVHRGGMRKGGSQLPRLLTDLHSAHSSAVQWLPELEPHLVGFSSLSHPDHSLQYSMYILWTYTARCTTSPASQLELWPLLCNKQLMTCCASALPAPCSHASTSHHPTVLRIFPSNLPMDWVPGAPTRIKWPRTKLLSRLLFRSCT